MRFGCNQRQYATLEPQVQKMTMVRVYGGPFVPATLAWPTTPPGTTALYDIRPDPATLVTGDYDDVIKTLVQAAPPGSMLTAWHEADRGTAHKGLASAEAREVHTYLNKLVGHLIPYGSVTTGGTATHPWTVEGLGFYGVDMYDFNLDDHPAYHLNAWSQTQYPGPRVVAETNSSVASHRPWWFAHVFGWLQANDGQALLTFWNPTGPLSGAWLPSDTATIHTLNQIGSLA